MALERIDPFIREDHLSLDHVLRYVWSSEFVDGKRVADAACGTGFGSVILAHANASEVVGIDASETAIQTCRDSWNHPNLHFRAGDITHLNHLLDTPCDRVVCFETLEHLEDPAAAIRAIADSLGAGGILIGSVPSESDVLDSNDFHQHAFTEKSLSRLLREGFQHIRIHHQRFSLASCIGSPDSKAVQPLDEQILPIMNMNFSPVSDFPETYVFLASDAPLPKAATASMGLSRSAWATYFTDAQRAYRDLAALQTRFRNLFFEHGDLKRRFTNILAWGQYYHAKSTGKDTKSGYLKKIEAAQSKREKQLREEVESLQEELKQLKKAVRDRIPEQEALSVKKRQRLTESLKKRSGD